MAIIRFHSCCCCLPLRFGVFVIALLGLLGGGVVSIVSFIQVANLKNAAHPSQANTVSVWIEAVTYALLVLCSLFGLIGAIIRKRGLVLAFSTLLLLMFGISLVSGSISLYHIFHDGAQKASTQCTNDVTQHTGDTGKDAVAGACKAAVRVADIIVVVIYVITWLFELWGAIIVSSYASQLREENEKQDMEQRIHRLESNEFNQPYNQPYRNDLKMSSHYSP